jgi:hypothetical protein
MGVLKCSINSFVSKKSTYLQIIPLKPSGNNMLTDALTVSTVSSEFFICGFV